MTPRRFAIFVGISLAVIVGTIAVLGIMLHSHDYAWIVVAPFLLMGGLGAGVFLIPLQAFIEWLWRRMSKKSDD